MLRRLHAVLLVLTLVAGLAAPAGAQQGPRLPIIRDTETENLLREYMRPLFQVAGVGGSQTNVVIINDRSFNAFVANGRRIFVNAGAIMDSRTPNELIGVLAHETGHIVGGHLARLREAIDRAQVIAAIGMIVGAGAVAAGSSRPGGAGEAGIGAMAGGMDIARRSLLSYQRGEEAAADRAALTYLDRTGQSARGMIETFRRFQNQQLFSARQADPYLLSHPMPQDRIANLEPLASRSPHWEKRDPPERQLRHDLVRAKLSGFLDRADTVARRYPASDTSLPARYARAIQIYRQGDRARGAALMGELARDNPRNAHFHELHGQFLFESGQARAAVGPLRRAVSLMPSAGLIRVTLGRALVAVDTPQATDEAIRELRQGLQREPESPDGYRQLAVAFNRKNERGQADLAAAEAALLEGDFTTARGLARRAQLSVPNGSPAWLRADEIVSQRPPRS